MRRKQVFKRDKLRAFKAKAEARKKYEEVVSQFVKAKKAATQKAEAAKTEEAKKKAK